MNDLISRQPDVPDTNVGDMISRQQAIDKHMIAVIDGVEVVPVSYIKSLPSAQPEIIYCEDCKHRDPEDKKCDCGHDILWQLPRRDDWYCADAERRIDG